MQGYANARMRVCHRRRASWLFGLAAKPSRHSGRWLITRGHGMPLPRVSLRRSRPMAWRGVLTQHCKECEEALPSPSSPAFPDLIFIAPAI